MKVGDLVTLISEHGSSKGIIVGLSEIGWFWIVAENGRKILWPGTQLRLLS